MTDGPSRRAAPRLVQVPVPVVVVIAGVAFAAVATSVTNAPDPAPFDISWRSASILAALGLCWWNLRSARRAWRAAGPCSAVALLHLWLFFAFSFAAAEQIYRSGGVELGHWEMHYDNPKTLAAVLMLGAFQALFFLALGRDVELSQLSRRLQPGAATERDLLLAGLLLALSLPFLVARGVTLNSLGLPAIAEAVVTRSDLFSYFDGKVHPLLWLLNAVFAVSVVGILCLAVRYAFPRPTRTAAFAYSGVLAVCVAGVAPSGGRNELVFVVLTVTFFMYVQGFRSPREFAPLALPVAAAGVGLFLVAQARLGGDNVLSNLAGDPYVGASSAAGEVTTTLGLGRFDAVLMIVDRHETRDNLGVANYVESLKGGLDAVFLPRIVTGQELGSVHVSDAVLGLWIFGEPKLSALPSAPGELYLSFGYVGVAIGAVAAGFVVRALLRTVGRMAGPVEYAWVLLLWTIARSLSDESHLVATFAARGWLMLAVVAAVLALRRRDGPTYFRPAAVPVTVGRLPIPAQDHRRPRRAEGPRRAEWKGAR